jgi:hypothetical protein
VIHGARYADEGEFRARLERLVEVARATGTPPGAAR